MVDELLSSPVLILHAEGHPARLLCTQQGPGSGPRAAPPAMPGRFRSRTAQRDAGRDSRGERKY